LDYPAAPVVLDDRACDADRVHAPVRVESPVLRRDDRVAEGRGNLSERNENPALDVQLGHGFVVVVVDPTALDGLEWLERGDGRGGCAGNGGVGTAISHIIPGGTAVGIGPSASVSGSGAFVVEWDASTGNEMKTSARSPLLNDFEWRGLITDATSPSELDAHLAEAPRAIYCGFDPTADNLP